MTVQEMIEKVLEGRRAQDVIDEVAAAKNDSAKAVSSWIAKSCGGKFKSDSSAPTKGTRFHGKCDTSKLYALLKSAGYKMTQEDERYGTMWEKGSSHVTYWPDSSVRVTGSASEKQKSKARRGYVQYD